MVQRRSGAGRSGGGVVACQWRHRCLVFDLAFFPSFRFSLAFSVCPYLCLLEGFRDMREKNTTSQLLMCLSFLESENLAATDGGQPLLLLFGAA